MRRVTIPLAAALCAGVMMAFQTADAAKCEESEFGETNGLIYLEAENQLIQHKHPEGALEVLRDIEHLTLNCYERHAMLRLRAAIAVEAGKPLVAIDDLREVMKQESFSVRDDVRLRNVLANLYLQVGNERMALKMFEDWLAAGAEPDRAAQLAIGRSVYPARQGGPRNTFCRSGA